MESLQISSGLKISDAKASIFEELRRMREWQDSQRQEFRNKQLMEHQKSLEETEMNIGKYYELNKEMFGLSDNSTNDQSQSASEVSFPDQSSSIYGHMQNCFSDDSYDNTPVGKHKRDIDVLEGPVSNGGFSSLSDISSQTSQVPQQEDVTAFNPKGLAPKKPVRPFLRKGAGLTRYKTRNKTNMVDVPKPSSVQQKAEIPQRKVVLKLKPALHTKNSPPRKTNRVKFCEPIQAFDCETIPKKSYDKTTENSDSQTSVSGEDENELGNIKDDKSQGFIDKGISYYASLDPEVKEQEFKELSEFEVLDNCTQNSSFNSDSSVVQRFLNGEPLKPTQNHSPNLHPEFLRSNYISTQTKEPENTAKDTNDNLEMRKQCLEEFITNLEPKITSLKNKATSPNKSAFEKYDSDDEKRCSTPVDDNDTLKDLDSSQNSSLNSIILAPYNANENKCHNILQDNDDGDSWKSSRFDRHINEENDNDDIANQNENMDKGQIQKSKLREKMDELEKEIQNYRTERAQLASISKERDTVLKELKKERDEFQKYKREELKKFHSEMESQRQQFKREKETFNRLKKVTKDYRNRKEREDLSTLKQEVEKLQKELKKEKIKFNNETRRLKSQLASAERERDNFKLHNMTLEDQIEELVASLKVRIALEGKSENKAQISTHLKAEKKNAVSNGRKGSFDDQDNKKYSDSSNHFKQVDDNLEPISLESSATQPKVRFNLSPQQSKNCQTSILADSKFVPSNDQYSENSRKLYGDFETETIGEYNFEKPRYEEIQHDDRIERIYNSGEVEIFFPSGTRKHVSADGETIKVYYSNGDVKEIFPDKRTVYRFVTGDIEQSFPSGLVITELLNGQIQKKNPDGSKKVTFPDGSHHITYIDGTQEITNLDGTKAHIDLNGTETIEFKNGEREIHTKEFKRREFPDGSVKTIYTSGRQETRYANGRIRIKDVNGKLVLDTKHSKELAGIPG